MILTSQYKKSIYLCRSIESKMAFPVLKEVSGEIVLNFDEEFYSLLKVSYNTAILRQLIINLQSNGMN